MDKKALLGSRIREIRRGRGLSQEALAEKASISAQYVSNIERGKENPTLDLLFKLADSLKVSLGELCDFEAVGINRREAKRVIGEVLKGADQERIQTAIRVLKAALR